MTTPSKPAGSTSSSRGGRSSQATWYAAATAYQALAASQQQPRADGVLLQRLRLGYCTREGESFKTASRGRSVATVGGMMIANHSSTIPCPAARRQPP